jgi:polysaccharide deacetylase family protein (PEP-CTERM system associated)
MSYYLLLTIDVEDWFQVENFKQYIPFASWSSYELRVEKNTHRLLDLLDSVSCQPSAVSSQPSDNLNQTESHSSQFNIDHGPESTDDRQDKKVRGTFFVLGWLAERLPNLVREIHSRGHEVASHGYYHNVCNEQSHEDLKADLCDCKKLLEDIIGAPVFGYRAPSFSINNDILKVIEECGYLYDSSYNSFSMHGRYGHLDLSQNCRRGIALKITSTKHQKPLPREIHDSDSEACLTGAKSKIKNQKSKIFYELPISNLKFAHQVFPWGGGGYFRLIPFPLFKIGIKFILGQENAYLFYFHPWEIDPDQPKVNDAPVFYKFRHYINLSKTHIKLSKLIENFTHCNFITCSQYLDSIGNSIF